MGGSKLDIIKSRQNINIKEYIKLRDGKKYRIAKKSFCIEGEKIFLEAISNKVDISKMYISKKFWKNIEKSIGLESIINSLGCKKYIINEEIKNYLMNTGVSSDIFCVCKKLDKQLSVDTIYSKKNFLFLCDLQNPGNMGNIIRTAEAFSIDGIIINNNCCDIYNPKTVKASMGSLFKVDIYPVEDEKSMTMLLKEKGFLTYATVLKDYDCSLAGFKFGSKNVIYFGNEGNGLASDIIDLCDRKLTIDMSSSIDSLNVSIASSVVMWEIMNQSKKF